jgi:hypothetical protein
MCALLIQAIQETLQPSLHSTGSKVCHDILKRPWAKAILGSGLPQSLYL